MKKKRVWLVALAVLILDGLVGVPSVPAIFTRTVTHYLQDYREAERTVTAKKCRGVPLVWKSCEVRITSAPVGADAGVQP